MTSKFIPCIGFAGPAGAGKDTAATRTALLLRQAGYDISFLSFAQPIKEMAKALVQYARPNRGVDDDTIEAYKRDEQINPLPGVQVSMRKLLQTIGTEWGRDCIDKDLWIKIATARMDDDPTRTYLVTDIRFDNEAEMVRQRGGFVIHLQRDGAGAGDHISEHGVSVAPADVVIPNNGTFEELQAALEGVLALKGVL